MSREILFKAKRAYNGEWVEGDLIQDRMEERFAISNDSGLFEVTRDSICQYTGFSDEEKNKIFEGDIVGFLDCISTENGYSEQNCIGQVVWSEETASFQVTERLSCESYEALDRGCKVLGNVFDNPELLEV